MIKTITKASPSTGKGQELLVHYVKRDGEGAPMEDLTLCGKMWDKPLLTTKNLCEDCLRIAKELGLV